MSATVTYAIDTQSITQALSVVEFGVTLVVTVINFILVWTHYGRSYNTFCSQYPATFAAKLETKVDTEIAMTDKQKTGDGGDEKDDAVNIEIIKGGSKYYSDSSTLAILTCFALTCYFLASVYSLLIESASKNNTFCANFIVPIVWLFTMGRGLQFCVYLARLDYLYGGEQCAYNKSTLMILATITLIIVIIIQSLQAMYVKESTLLLNNSQFPFFCEFLLIDFVLISMLVFDIALSVIAVILFWVPLRKIKEGRDDATKQLLVKFGMKYAIIVTITSSWTVLNYILIISNGFTLLAPTMLAVNSISLVLLGPYYSSTLASCYECLGFGTIHDIKEAIKKKN